MTAYYNENDPYVAQWLRNLIDAGHIAPGYVDERSIEDVRPSDLEGFAQCHFFAGIGGWSLALRLAGWPDDRPVWTGSPPCQPFSVAGRRHGYDDARHLAPKWLDFIRERRPPEVFGEQVASAASGKQWAWLDDLQDALEAESYATGAIVLPACGVGAPHIRQRTWFVARRVGDSEQQGLEGHGWDGDDRGEPGRERPQPCGSATASGAVGGMADNQCVGRQRREGAAQGGEFVGPDARRQKGDNGPFGVNEAGDGSQPARPPDNLWRSADWLFCRDGKWRPVEPGTFPLANGVSGRVGRLRAYGNAIVPQEAAQIIRATI